MNLPENSIRMRLQDLAARIGGELFGDPDLEIQGIGPFDEAGGNQIALAGGASYLKRIEESRAGALIVPKDFRHAGKNLVAVKNPHAAFADTLALFHPRIPPKSGISPKAYIGEDFVCGEQVCISPLAYVGNRVQMGSRVMIHPHVVIEDDVRMGDDVELYANVTIRERCRLGSRIIIHPGTVIGSDGFGFAADGEKYKKINHVGIVQIDDDVEIGALNAVDRAVFGKTWIQRGVKTDNLVQIAHNVVIGENTLLVAQVGISGSTTIGRHAILAGQVGVSGHLNIGDHVIVGPQSGIAKSIPSGQIVTGSPGMPHKQWLRIIQTFPRLPEWRKKLAELEKRLAEVEKR